MKKSRIISGLAAVVLTFSGTGVIGYANGLSAAGKTQVSSASQNDDEVVDEYALSGDEGLTGADMFDDSDNIEDIEEDDYDFKVGDYSYYYGDDEDTATIVKYYGTEETVRIPSTVAYGGKTFRLSMIENEAFQNNKKIKSVIIPEGVTSIGCDAFSNCSSLSFVNFPKTLTTIEEYAFYSCYNLESVTSPSGLTSIGEYAFSNTALMNVKLPDSVTYIGEGAFSECKELTSFTLPSKLELIKYGTFSYCPKLSSITIPASVKRIGMAAFENCTSLTSITIPSNVQYIEDTAFGECTSLSSVNLSAGIEKIGNWAFTDTAIKNVTIPSTVKIIGDRAFNHCNELVTVNIANGVPSIGKYAFNECPKLTTVTIPDSVKKIGSYAFNECSLLDTVTGMKNVSDFGARVFNGTKWLADRQNESPFVIVNGSLLDATKTTNSVIVPAEATIINAYAFDEAKITDVRFAGKVEAIRAYAFNNCNSLNKITLGDSLDRIGMCAFNGCWELSGIELPSSLRVVRNRAFSGSHFYSYTLPDSITSIDRYGFYGGLQFGDDDFEKIVVNFKNKTGRLSNLRMGVRMPNANIIKIGEGITEIDNYFYLGKDLKKVYIPKSVTKIGERAFGYYLVFNNPHFKNDIIFDRFNYYTDYNYSYKYNRDLVICCYEGTAGEQYAIANGFKKIGTEGEMLMYKTADVATGDANGDNKINIDDLVLVQKKAAGWNVSCEDGADTNGDNKIDLKDLIYMQKLIAGWKVEPAAK